MKRMYIGIAVAAVIVGGVLVARGVKNAPTATPTPTAPVVSTSGAPIAADLKNGSYNFGEDKTITLVNGVATVKGDSGGASDVATITYAGHEAMGDMDGDGKADTAFIMTITTGGTGTFYIVELALGSEGTSHNILPYLLGDRISIENLSIVGGTLTISYLDHTETAALTDPPTVSTTKKLTFKDGQFVAPAVTPVK